MTDWCKCPFRAEKQQPCIAPCLDSETPGICDFCQFHMYDTSENNKA